MANKYRVLVSGSVWVSRVVTVRADTTEEALRAAEHKAAQLPLKGWRFDDGAEVEIALENSALQSIT